VQAAARYEGAPNGLVELENALEYALRIFTGKERDVESQELTDALAEAARTNAFSEALRKQKEEALERRLKEVIRHSPLVIHVGDTSGRYPARLYQAGAARVAVVSTQEISRELLQFSACLNGLQQMPVLGRGPTLPVRRCATCAWRLGCFVAMDTWLEAQGKEAKDASVKALDAELASMQPPVVASPAEAVEVEQTTLGENRHGAQAAAQGPEGRACVG
jgi:hypothetical protein